VSQGQTLSADSISHILTIFCVIWSSEIGLHPHVSGGANILFNEFSQHQKQRDAHTIGQ